MAKIIAFMGADDAKVWLNPAYVTRVGQSGTGYVSVHLATATGGPLLLKGEADEVVAKINEAMD